MKKFAFTLIVTAVVTVSWPVFRWPASAQEVLVEPSKTNDESFLADVTMVSPNVVISQFQPGTTANANDEFIEIHNRGTTPFDLNGHRLVYRSQNGTNDVGPMAVWTTSTILQPGQFYLVASTSYSGGAAANMTYNPSVCLCSLSASNGGLAIRSGDMNTGPVVDAVGWGTGTNTFVEGTRTTAPPSGSSKGRKTNGCQDTDNNSADFETITPFAPRNTSTTITCTGGSATIFASMNANPSTASPGTPVLFTVNVQPASEPPSTNITVIGDLTGLGGSGSQVFYDNGTNGDATAGDNIFSYTHTVPTGTTGGTYTIVATAADAEGRSFETSVNLVVNAPLPNEDPLLFGNPSHATPDVVNENNYLMVKPQYTLAYNRSRATANWVAWRLASNWIGSSGRNDSFREDPTLPAGWYRVQDFDYSGSGFDRGHMVPSGDRTNTVENNMATFLMTNIVPQLGANNQGPWNDFENYVRSLLSAGNEIYIISGPQGQHATVPTIAGGRIVVPKWTWKVVLILPNGSNDLKRVTRTTRALGVIMSNEAISQSAPWRNFRVTVDQVEMLTGYNFFSALPPQIQEAIERRRDTQ
jgi:endonuclease G, mitochondrial